jgi:hypothetical protein
VAIPNRLLIKTKKAGDGKGSFSNGPRRRSEQITPSISRGEPE